MSMRQCNVAETSTRSIRQTDAWTGFGQHTRLCHKSEFISDTYIEDSVLIMLTEDIAVTTPVCRVGTVILE